MSGINTREVTEQDLSRYGFCFSEEDRQSPEDALLIDHGTPHLTTAFLLYLQEICDGDVDLLNGVGNLKKFRASILKILAKGDQDLDIPFDSMLEIVVRASGEIFQNNLSRSARLRKVAAQKS